MRQAGHRVRPVLRASTAKRRSRSRKRRAKTATRGSTTPRRVPVRQHCAQHVPLVLMASVLLQHRWENAVCVVRGRQIRRAVKQRSRRVSGVAEGGINRKRARPRALRAVKGSSAMRRTSRSVHRAKHVAKAGIARLLGPPTRPNVMPVGLESTANTGGRSARTPDAHIVSREPLTRSQARAVSQSANRVPRAGIKPWVARHRATHAQRGDTTSIRVSNPRQNAWIASPANSARPKARQQNHSAISVPRGSHPTKQDNLPQTHALRASRASTRTKRRALGAPIVLKAPPPIPDRRDAEIARLASACYHSPKRAKPASQGGTRSAPPVFARSANQASMARF